MKSKIHEHQKNNFKIVSKKLIIAALLVVSISAFAQDQNQQDKKSDRGSREMKSPEERNEARLKKMTTDLNLDAKQQEQIKPIIAEQTAKRDAMMAERMANKDSQKKMTADERQVFMNSRKEERTAMENKLKAILSPEQFKKMKDIEQANMEKMREARESREPREPREPKDNNGEN
jgi:periplasmic protein CpxP/Spy